MLWVPHNPDTHQGIVYADDDRPHLSTLQATSWALVLGIGFSLALIAAALAWLASTAHQAMALRTAG